MSRGRREPRSRRLTPGDICTIIATAVLVGGLIWLAARAGQVGQP